MCDEPTDVIQIKPCRQGSAKGTVEWVRRSFLKVLQGGGRHGRGRVVQLDDTALVAGRSSNADLLLDTAGASRRHFEIRPQLGAYVLRDLQSTNGTKVNNTQVAECRLSDGDIISVDDVEIVFYEETRLIRR
jgi:pSer/pThr/pTyr-binding forkhead associated (FHA) protein